MGGEPVEAWLAFSCQHHRDQLIAPRELLGREGAVLADWQERERRNAHGRGLHPPQPLAVGASGAELVKRALDRRPNGFSTSL